MENAQINDKDYWISSNEEHAIWFDKKFKNWKIGYQRHKGTSKCAMYSIHPRNALLESPSDIGKNWTSVDDSNSFNIDETIDIQRFKGKTNKRSVF